MTKPNKRAKAGEGWALKNSEGKLLILSIQRREYGEGEFPSNWSKVKVRITEIPTAKVTKGRSR